MAENASVKRKRNNSEIKRNRKKCEMQMLCANPIYPIHVLNSIVFDKIAQQRTASISYHRLDMRAYATLNLHCLHITDLH